MEREETKAISRNEKSILRSVVYSSLFEYPLAASELPYSLQDASLSEEEILELYGNSRWLQKRVAFENGFFVLRGREKDLTTRSAREALARAKLTRHRALLGWIGRLPNIRLLALSGSAAHLTMSEEADIDLFIVTRGHRVWSTAVAILLMSRLLGCRKLLCFNYLIADSRLRIEERNLFTANQIIHLLPLRGRAWLERLREANPWVDRIYPGSQPPRHCPAWLVDGLPVSGVPSGWLERISTGAAGAAAENLCRTLYSRYLLWKSGSWKTPEQVRLERDLLKLHTSSHASAVLELYETEVERALEQAGSTKDDGSSI